MKNANKKLDKAAAVARRAETTLRTIAAKARAGADEACSDGLSELSATLRKVASKYEMAAAYACEGYALGRTINHDSGNGGGGIIKPAMGGKGG